jgi:hypothetical protein
MIKSHHLASQLAAERTRDLRAGGAAARAYASDRRGSRGRRLARVAAAAGAAGWRLRRTHARRAERLSC